MSFTPLFGPFEEKPPTQFLRGGKAARSVLFREQLTITGWLALGGLLTSGLFVALGRLALLIPVAVVAAKTVNTLLIVLGLKNDPYSTHVINGAFSAQLPNEDGTFGPEPSSQGVTVLLIGSTSNHQLGIFAPGLKETGDYMVRMQKDVNDRAEEYGMLASSFWLGTEKEAANGNMIVMYFKNYEGLHRFAHDPLHREAWNWWNKTHAQHPHIHIWHEAFNVPAGQWESIYMNGRPSTLSGGMVPFKTTSGKTQWLSTIVDASRGVLRSSKGRMRLTDGRDNEKYQYDPYDTLKAEA